MTERERDRWIWSTISFHSFIHSSHYNQERRIFLVLNRKINVANILEQNSTNSGYSGWKHYVLSGRQNCQEIEKS